MTAAGHLSNIKYCDSVDNAAGVWLDFKSDDQLGSFELYENGKRVELHERGYRGD